MKKLLVIICFLFLLTGCEKKETISFAPHEVLNIWVSSEEEIWKALGLEFQSTLNRNDLVLNVVTFPNDEELQNTLINTMAEGTAPDIIYTDGLWIAQNSTKFVPLKDEILTPEKLKLDFVKSVSDVLIKDNAIIGVPMGIDTLAIFYNEEHFIKHLKNRNKPGKTWKEFKSDVVLLTKKNNSFQRFSVSGTSMGRVDNVNYGVHILENLLFQMVGNLFSIDGMEAVFAKDGGVTSDGKQVNFGLDAFLFFLSFANPRFENFSWNEFLVNNNDSEYLNFNTFVKGKVSMIFGYSQDLKKIKKIITEQENAISEHNVRVAFFPQFEEDVANPKLLARVKSLAVPISTQKKDFAWKFLKFAIQKDILRGFSRATGLPTPLLSLLSEQESEDNLGIFVRQAKFARVNILPLPRNEFLENFKNLINDVNLLRISPKEGLKKLQNKFTNELIRRKKLQNEINKSLELIQNEK